MGAFEPEIIVIDYAITLRYLYETSILDGKYLFAETKKSQLHFKNTLQGIFKVFKVFFKKLLQIYSICTFAYAFAFKFKYAVAHAHPHAQMYLHLHLHVHLHSLAHAVHNFICAHVQCIGIRACIIFALPNCCFCSIFLDIRSSPQFFLLEKYFPTIFLLEKPLFAYTPFRHHFFPWKNFL